MIDLIIEALLPITVILALGFFAGMHHDFNKDQANVLNSMVMKFALPLCLFTGLVTSSIKELIQQEDMAIVLFIGMVGFYIIIYLIFHYIIKMNMRIAALFSLALTSPSVNFIGVSVLGDLFGPISLLGISIVNIWMNVFLVSITMIFLSVGESAQQNATNPSVVTDKPPILKSVLEAFKAPVVWAPILGFILVILDVKLPKSLISSFDLLGKATSGVALFATGIILYSYKIVINKTIISMVLIKNLAIPFAIWGVILLLGFPHSMIKETVLITAIPPAFVSIILSIQYKEGEQQMASILFFSTIFSIITLALFIFILP